MPTSVTSPTSAIAYISSGYMSDTVNCVHADGSLSQWGSDASNQITGSTALTRPILNFEVATNEHSTVAIDIDGNIKGWGLEQFWRLCPGSFGHCWSWKATSPG